MRELGHHALPRPLLTVPTYKCLPINTYLSTYLTSASFSASASASASASVVALSSCSCSCADDSLATMPRSLRLCHLRAWGARRASRTAWAITPALPCPALPPLVSGTARHSLAQHLAGSASLRASM
ncbi:unnamed protein product [Laminaria digitata]